MGSGDGAEKLEHDGAMDDFSAAFSEAAAEAAGDDAAHAAGDTGVAETDGAMPDASAGGAEDDAPKPGPGDAAAGGAENGEAGGQDGEPASGDAADDEAEQAGGSDEGGAESAADASQGEGQKAETPAAPETPVAPEQPEQSDPADEFAGMTREQLIARLRNTPGGPVPAPKAPELPEEVAAEYRPMRQAAMESNPADVPYMDAAIRVPEIQEFLAEGYEGPMNKLVVRLSAENMRLNESAALTAQNQQALNGQLHALEIGVRHPGFLADPKGLAGAVADWGKSQKDWPEIQAVMRSGTAAEVVGVLDRYTAGQAEAEPEPKPDPKVEEKRRKAAKRAAATPTKAPTGVEVEPDKDDFSGGFKMSLKEKVE